MLEELQSLLRDISDNPLRAAARLDALVVRMREIAAVLRAHGQGGNRDPGGMVDRVQVQVKGPDGRVVQSADTLRN